MPAFECKMTWTQQDLGLCVLGTFEISSVAFIVASCLMRDMEKLTDFTAATPEFVLKE